MRVECGMTVPKVIEYGVWLLLPLFFVEGHNQWLFSLLFSWTMSVTTPYTYIVLG